jgi:hypothetical protein
MPADPMSSANSGWSAKAMRSPFGENRMWLTQPPVS